MTTTTIMAPLCPEEVDVFTVPHSRMKELVYKYLDMLTSTNFSSVHHLTELLENLNKTFNEFIAHEQIENRFIMKKLKNKLRSLSIQNTAVCNCHNDNKLTDMLSLLQDGYKCTKKSESDRINFGIKLRGALEQFTETFLPHMAEEEEVFQPLLMQHFSVEELKQIKATVIQQHFKVEAEDEAPEKCVQDNKSSKACTKLVETKVLKTEIPSRGIEDLPNEILEKVMSHLNPQDLCRCAQVSKRWNQVSLTGSLWTRIYPVSWANGDWGSEQGVYDEDGQDLEQKLAHKVYDEDADVDESEEITEDVWQVQKESRMLTSICKHLLPRVGASVKHCDLAYSRGITNGTMYKLLTLCPHLTYLDLTQTRISDLAFKGLQKNGGGKKLKHLDLSGCLYITDTTLQRVSAAIGQIPCHMTQEDSHMTPDNDHVTQKNADKEQEDSFSVCAAPEEHGPDLCDAFEENVQVATDDCHGNKESAEDFPENHHKDIFDDVGVDCPWIDECPVLCEKGQCRVPDQERDRVRCCLRQSQYKMKNGEDAAQRLSRDSEGSMAERVRCCRNLGQGHCAKNRSGSSGDPNGYHGILDTGPGSKSMLDKAPLVNTFNVENDPLQRTYLQRDPYGEECDKGLINECDTDVFENVNNMLKSTEDVGNQSETPKTEGQTDLGDMIISAETWFPSLETSQDNSGSETAVEPAGGLIKDLKYVPAHGQARDLNRSPVPVGRGLEFLSLSGCYQLTDEGLDCLTDNGGLPHLRHLDLSGCLNLGGEAVSQLVGTCDRLDPANLFYCDNILDGPYSDMASGCQNLQCSSRVCCRGGE